MAVGGNFGWPKITFDRISRHFISIRNFHFFTKWLPAAILDDRKSFLITFHKWLPATILDDRKSLSNAFLTISLFGRNASIIHVK